MASDSDIDHIILKMTKNEYHFGGTLRKQIYDDEVLRKPWGEIFNFGVASNGMVRFDEFLHFFNES